MNTSSSFSLQRIAEAYQQENSLDEQFKYIVLYRAVKACIEQNKIPDNWLLPSSRVLSAELGLSRTTVNTAYELLMLEKLVKSKPGSGYRVNQQELVQTLHSPTDQTPVQSYPEISELGKAVLKNVPLLNRQPDVGIAFKPGLPPIDLFPINRWKNLLNGYWRHVRASDLSYGQSTAAEHLKRQICNYLFVSRSIKVSPEQVVVVTGSLQSLYFIASALINPGDPVMIEDPTFPNVHSIFKSFRAHVFTFPATREGIELTPKKKMGNWTPKLIHVTPSDHYPFGMKMSLEKRLDLLKRASKDNALIIENDFEHEIANQANSIPTLFSLDEEHRTIYLGTFNRLLYPSIRLGYMLLPLHLIPVMKAFEEHSYRFVSPSLQMVMGQFIERNHLYQHLKNVIEAAQDRLSIFKQHFQAGRSGITLSEQDHHSLHLVATLGEHHTIEHEKRLIAELARRKISVFPLSNCYVNQPPISGLIIGYATSMPAVIRQKAPQMQEAIEQFA